MTRIAQLVLAAAIVIAPTAASAQDSRGTPVYGTVRLSSGFAPDPHTINLTAGGSISADRINANGCVGQIGSNPDYVVNYSAESLDLYIRANSSEDTSLVVRDPGGRWQCNDDYNGLNPEIRISSPRSGSYAIWVGSVSGESVQARLEISELREATSSDAEDASSIDMSAEASFGEVILRSGFNPDPHRVEITSGGTIDASSINSQCAGQIASAPDYELTYRDAGNFPLSFSFISGEGDTTLVINGPDGQWYCDDDSAGNQNPRVVLRDAQDGVYDIWIGSFGGGNYTGQLQISEIN